MQAPNKTPHSGWAPWTPAIDQPSAHAGAAPAENPIHREDSPRISLISFAGENTAEARAESLMFWLLVPALIVIFAIGSAVGYAFDQAHHQVTQVQDRRSSED